MWIPWFYFVFIFKNNPPGLDTFVSFEFVV